MSWKCNSCGTKTGGGIACLATWEKRKKVTIKTKELDLYKRVFGAIEIATDHYLECDWEEEKEFILKKIKELEEKGDDENGNV